MEEIARMQTEAGEYVIFIDGDHVVCQTPDGVQFPMTAAQARAFGDQMLAAANDPSAETVRVSIERRIIKPDSTFEADR